MTVIPLFCYCVVQFVRWAARKGLRDDHDASLAQRNHAARRTGMRGETYAYWYLRRHGYVFVARNYTPRGVKGELDLVGFDGETLACDELPTPTLRDALPAGADSTSSP